MADLKWRSDRIRWGPDGARWSGEDSGIVEFVPAGRLGANTISAEYPDGTEFHVWTGIGDVTVGGITYTGVGPDVIDIGEHQVGLTGQNRMTISLSDIDPEYRNLFLQDPGRVWVTIKLIYSDDGGNTWVEIPRYIRGVAGRSQLQGGRYSVEVSTYTDTLDRGYEQVWSDESQQEVYPGDLGFAHLRTLSSGGGIDIRWP